ncbi:MAG: hypothetical protein QXH80_01510 [Candidatus Nanoarchaeia archaeon]
MPDSATEVQEWVWEDGVTADYSYLLKAKVSRKHFDSFVSKLGLTPDSQSRKYSQGTGGPSWLRPAQFTGNWWNPSPSLDGTLVYEDGHTWSLAKYENGYLYFMSFQY